MMIDIEVGENYEITGMENFDGGLGTNPQNLNGTTVTVIQILGQGQGRINPGHEVKVRLTTADRARWPQQEFWVSPDSLIEAERGQETFGQ